LRFGVFSDKIERHGFKGISLMKRGFTLLEMLVVIGIISVLATLLVPRFSAISENARSLRCKSKLKTLGAAALTYNTMYGQMPFANDGKAKWLNDSGNLQYRLGRGWVCGGEPGKNYPEFSDSLKESRETSSDITLVDPLYYGENGYTSITNGSLWSLVGNADAYLCETFKKGVTVKDPRRSYVMNRLFGLVDGGKYVNLQGREVGRLYPDIPEQKNAWNSEEYAQDSKTLLFAEMELTGKSGRSGVVDFGENIGFLHKVGRRDAANVCFADGHVETLLKPSGGGISAYVTWLCSGGICGSEPASE